MIPGPICTCPDTRWHFAVYVEGDLVAEHVIDTDAQARERLDIEHEAVIASADHFALVEKAMDEDRDWKVETLCPSCRRGARFSPAGPEIIEP